MVLGWGVREEHVNSADVISITVLQFIILIIYLFIGIVAKKRLANFPDYVLPIRWIFIISFICVTIKVILDSIIAIKYEK